MTVHIDLGEMSRRYGVPEVEIILKINIMSPDWGKPDLLRGISETEELIRDAESVVIHGRSSTYIMAAIALAACPLNCGMDREFPDGSTVYEPFLKLGVGERNPVESVVFTLSEVGDRTYVEYDADYRDGGGGFDIKCLADVKIPPIQAGSHVMLSGKAQNSLAISIAMGYAGMAKSIAFPDASGGRYICVYSNCPEMEVGDALNG